jgi:hypothetical protein
VVAEVLELASAETGAVEPEGGALPSAADGAAGRDTLEPSCATGVAAAGAGGATGTSSTGGGIIVAGWPAVLGIVEPTAATGAAPPGLPSTAG